MGGKNSDLKRITEGGTDIFVHKQYFGQPKGPKEKLPDTVFYNPEMALGRDVNVGFFSIAGCDGWDVLDGLAGCGVRGLRVANESGVDITLYCNDGNPDSTKLIRRNARLNKLTGVKVLSKRLQSVLSDRHFSYVDIDPFGTPVQFIHYALDSVRHKGYMSVTATDTAVLCGAYPKTCRRRYGAEAIKGTPTHEMGLRILTGFIAREGAKMDIGTFPVLAHATQHYMRVYVRLEKSPGKADKALSSVGKMDFDKKTQRYSEISPEAAGGPLWTGKLQDGSLLKKMLETDFTPADEKRYPVLVHTLAEEADLPPGYYETNALAKALKRSAVPYKDITGRIEAMGYRWSRTHVMPNAFKTDAPYEDVIRAFKGK
jgi:tRNA (guanine26-N2/guanine27-N2)-dimethyltransferase